MTEELALLIAYNILRDELDNIKVRDDCELTDSYYQEIETAANKIKEMMVKYH